MTTKAYLESLSRLNLTPASRTTAALLGLSVSQIQRIALGKCRVPDPVALLLRMYEEHGIDRP